MVVELVCVCDIVCVCVPADIIIWKVFLQSKVYCLQFGLIQNIIYGVNNFESIENFM